MRDSDLPLEDWDAIRDEIDEIAGEARTHVRIVRDYGFPSDGPERRCSTMSRSRLFVDAWGRLVSCCQLSDYGFNDAEVVADLTVVPLAEALGEFHAHLDRLIDASAPRSDALAERFPCMRCARANGKLAWLRDHARSPWAPVAALADHANVAPTSLVTPVPA